MDEPESSDSKPVNGDDGTVQNGSQTVAVAATSSASSPVQTGKVFVGPGGNKEAERIGLGLSKLRSSQLDDLELAKKYAMDQSIKYLMEKQRQVHQQQQQKVALYSQALALMARIYVGSVNFDVFEDQVRSAFGSFGPIKHVNMSIDPSTGNHKGFCFIEYEIPEAAYLAREAMNGKFLGGRTIKVMPVGRSDSTPQAQPIIDMVQHEATRYNRVYVASVHPDITEQDLRSVFMAFGEITKCQMARPPSAKKHRGFGYIEFKTAESVRDAIEGMSGFDLGGQFLQVGRCITPPDAINYLSGGTNWALPAASAIAAAEMTAKIHAQEVRGPTKSSPSESPSQADTSPPCSSPPPPPQPLAPSGGRRRGFGGFAGSTVPPPAVIQSLPAPQLLPAAAEPGSSSAGSSPAQGGGDEAVQKISAPQLVIPQLGAGAAPAPQQQPLAVADEASISDFYSTLKDERFEAPKLVQSAPGLVQLPQLSSNPAEQYKPEPVALITSPLQAAVQKAHAVAQAKRAKKERKAANSAMNLLDRIGEKAKSKSDGFDASKPASFAPLPKYLRPKDPNAVEDEDEDEEDEAQLAIGGPESWSALALREDKSKMLAKKTDHRLVKRKGDKQKGGKRERKPRKKGKRPRISSGPKLNSATKIAAASLAGALSDTLQTQKDERGEEASLASQEHVQIRGNDARHLLIQKLMRTNRSSVLVLRNMVRMDGVDEFLEEEIREECGKYGRVNDVVIVQEEDSGSVKIFVRFADPSQAEEARKAIDGRFFDGRTVLAQAYDQVLFDHDDFTG